MHISFGSPGVVWGQPASTFDNCPRCVEKDPIANYSSYPDHYSAYCNMHLLKNLNLVLNMIHLKSDVMSENQRYQKHYNYMIEEISLRVFSE